MKKHFAFIILFTVLSYAQALAQTNTFPSNGNVGIGTTSPGQKLDIVNGNIRLSDGYELFFTDHGQIRSFDYNHRILFRRSENIMELREFGSIVFSSGATSGSATNKVIITSGGNVGIGTTNPQAKLAVNGDIFSKKVKVTQSGWPDYVFASGYKLPPLAEVEQFIKQQHHLPDVPSAAEVEKNGLDLGDNQAALLKKIEELTLYIINLNKEVEALKQELKKDKSGK
ncbi:hypothetical protein [Niastella populi]|uniref:FecR protein domain-containing protein n=1 Tax=Niastella populi TaxID=550983 RepID=A0A1V9G1Y7_9BACT|nr:hypothetical protein [Niastella populi]OQP64633.1 hypothetical protein A4R26_16445 [Niastella populi]